MVDLNLSSIDVFYWNTISRMGENCPPTVQPAFIIPAVELCARSEGWQIIHGQGSKGRYCVFLSCEIYLNTSSYPPVHQSSGYLHLLPMIYDCSPRGIHSATTDSEEWKISHSSPHFSYKNISNASRKEKYFKHGLFDIHIFFSNLMSDHVWWFLLSPSNQFCHHKSFSMFFLWQFSLGKKKN